jgi:hypothetical protein
MERLSDSRVRFTPEEISELKAFAKEHKLKFEYVAMNAALFALGHPGIPPSEYQFGVEYAE